MIRILLFILMFFFLLLSSALWWLDGVDWDAYRADLARQISVAVGADVAIDGSLSIAIFPFPTLEAHDALLSADGMQITAPELRLVMEFWPLLRGDVILSRAVVNAPIIALTPDQWSRPAETHEQIATENTDTAQVQLRYVEINNGQLMMNWHGQTEVFNEIYMELSAPDWGGPYNFRGDFSWRDADFDFMGTLGVRTHASVRPLDFHVRQLENDEAVYWRGAMKPIPFSLRGDVYNILQTMGPLPFDGRQAAVPDPLTCDNSDAMYLVRCFLVAPPAL